MATLTAVLNIPPITLGNRLRLAREWRDLEQADVAENLGLTRQTVSNYERGATTPGKLVIAEWARTCRVDFDWLNDGSYPGGGPQQTHSEITNRYHAPASNDRYLSLVA